MLIIVHNELCISVKADGCNVLSRYILINEYTKRNQCIVK